MPRVSNPMTLTPAELLSCRTAMASFSVYLNSGATVTLSAEVLVADKLSAEEAARLSDDFQEIGLSTDVREVAPRRSLDLAWVILATLPWKPFIDKLDPIQANSATTPCDSRVTLRDTAVVAARSRWEPRAWRVAARCRSRQ
jgi:hypothetical protein